MITKEMVRNAYEQGKRDAKRYGVVRLSALRTPIKKRRFIAALEIAYWKGVTCPLPITRADFPAAADKALHMGINSAARRQFDCISTIPGF